jgi:DNA-binding NtrC family response regulator
MNRSLLIVDDEKLVRWTLQQSMDKENYKIVLASNGTDAAEEIQKEHFDVIITDLLMPGMDGIEVARKAKEIHPDTKIVMMTAFGSVLNREKAAEAGVSHFLDKPFSVDEVKSVVSQLLSED